MRGKDNPEFTERARDAGRAVDAAFTSRRGPRLVGASVLSAAGDSLADLERALLRGQRVSASFSPSSPPARISTAHLEALRSRSRSTGREAGLRVDRALLLSECAIDAALGVSEGEPGRDDEVSTTLYLATALGDSECVEESVRAGDAGAAGAFEGFARTLLRDRPRWRHGGIFSVTCVSALCALEQAVADLELGRTSRAVLVAFDALSRTMRAGFTAMRAVSPMGACRPFDRRHDGIVLGEAVCALVLERGDARGSRTSGVSTRVRASRLASDAFHMTSPDPSGRGMASAIRRALDDAALDPRELGAVLLTAIGSPLYDAMLERALREALGDELASRLPVSSWETATGHALAATGALAIAVAARSIESGRIPPLAAIEERDPRCALDLVVDAPRPLARRQILALVVGFGGQNGAVVVGEVEE